MPSSTRDVNDRSRSRRTCQQEATIGFECFVGWGGNHPMDVPVFVVSHSVPDGWPREDAPFTFVGDGIESALAQARAVAGEKMVGVATATLTQQYLNAGLLDEIWVNLVPVLLGRGIRFFDNLAGAPIELEGPTVVEGSGVTHLCYRVRR
ncbi:dihydrofolate reductase family protein [Streptosporangium sp. NPDC003464]